MDVLASQTANILLGLVVVAWLLWNQLRTRRVREKFAQIYFLLGVIGLAETYTIISEHASAVGAVAIIWIVVSLVTAALLGVIRATTVKIWRDAAGMAWRKGTAVTIILWIIALGIHFGFEFVIDHASAIATLGSATFLLYLAISLGVQREVVRQRALRILQEVTIQ
jgi:hypothetical protein